MKKYFLIGGIVLGVLLIFLAALFCLLILLPSFRDKKIENIKHLYFTYTSGYAMYSYATYTLDCNEECILTVKPIGVPDEEKQTVEIPKEKVKQIETVLNKNHVSRWNGFNKNDKYVLDGDSFSFNLDYNEKDKVEAHGYMKWPNNYSIVKSYLVTEFDKYIEGK